jgi:hypothetical protein
VTFERAAPKLSGVPVVMPQRRRPRFVEARVAAGDVVLLVFADFSLDRWKSGAGKSDPLGIVEGLLARHAVADAIAIPCLWDPRGAPPAAA